MRWNAACVVVCSLIVVFSGCKNTKKKSDASLGAYDPYAYSSTADTPRYEPLAVPAYDTTPAYNTTGSDSTWATPVADSGASSGARYHTVAKGDTLYSLARQYYGNQSKWKEVYEANRAQLPDPNRIRVGQRLLIP